MAGRMIQLTMAYGGKPVFINPLLLSSVCPPHTDDNERDEIATPMGVLNPKIGAHVMTAGDQEGIAVAESVADVVARWEDAINA